MAIIKAKPFVKWAGGKTRLLPTIDSFLPKNFEAEQSVTYIEPFVGGGAMLFYMLQAYPNIRRAVINDINSHLTNTYRVIRDFPEELIAALREIQFEYRELGDEESKKQYYLSMRNRFNTANLSELEDAACFIFLNRTCFNGLYRENAKGLFNVPFGRYKNPTICDEDLIRADSECLQKVTILNGDFSQIDTYIDGYTLIYFDPPYRPLTSTSSFNSYVKEAFNDDEQIRLKNFFATISKSGNYALLSNSDGHSKNQEDIFFDELYQDFIIQRVNSSRSISANPTKRGNLTELLIRNYEDCKGPK